MEIPAVPSPAPSPVPDAEGGLVEKVRRIHAELQGKNYYEAFGT